MDPVTLTIVGIVVTAAIGAPAWFPYLSRLVGRETAETSVQDGFEKIWTKGWSDSEAVAKSQKMGLAKYAPNLLYKKYEININIVNSDGDANIEFYIEAINIGSDPVLGESKSIWIEEGAGKTKIEATNRCNSLIRIEIKRDYSNIKYFYCAFADAVAPGDSICYGYSYFVPKMFVQSHYWDTKVDNLTKSLVVNISHAKGLPFQTAYVEREGNDGILQEPTSNLDITSDEKITTIRWNKPFPSRDAKYTINWSFQGDS